MPTNNILYRSFKKDYNKIEKMLLLPIDIMPISSSDEILCKTSVRLKSLWDTGATLTAIKPKLRDALNLQMVRTGSSAKVFGLGTVTDADFTVLNLKIRHNFEIHWCPVYIIDYNVDVDIIIGMDIISMGDFAISNADQRTSFSFIAPSMPERLDLTEKAKTLNSKIII